MLGYLPESVLCSKSKSKRKSVNDDIAVEFKSMRKHARIKSHTLQCNQKYKHLVPKLFDVLHQIKEETGSPGKSIF